MSDTEFAYELRDLLNRHNQENASSTPDHALAAFLLGCLKAYEQAVRERDAMANRATKPQEVADATETTE